MCDKGFRNTYKRMDWTKPSPTITTYNRTISSQQNVHPGRKAKIDGKFLYSDPRALTLYEIMKIMTIPDTIALSSSDNTPQLRSFIGEGIPPLFINRCFKIRSKTIFLFILHYLIFMYLCTPILRDEKRNTPRKLPHSCV